MLLSSSANRLVRLVTRLSGVILSYSGNHGLCRLQGAAESRQHLSESEAATEHRCVGRLPVQEWKQTLSAVLELQSMSQVSRSTSHRQERISSGVCGVFRHLHQLHVLEQAPLGLFCCSNITSVQRRYLTKLTDSKVGQLAFENR